MRERKRKRKRKRETEKMKATEEEGTMRWRTSERREARGGVACKASLIRWRAVQCFSPDTYAH